MGFVDGHILRDAPGGRGVQPTRPAATASDSIVDVPGRSTPSTSTPSASATSAREGYIDRQLKRWYGQFEQSQDP